MASYDVSEIEYGNNNYPLVDSKSRAALTTAINSNDGRKNLLNIAGLYPKVQTASDGTVFTINDDGTVDFDATNRTGSSAAYIYILPGCNSSGTGNVLVTEFPTILYGTSIGRGNYGIQASVAPTGSSTYTTYYQDEEPIELPAGTIRWIRLVVQASFKKASSFTPMLCYKTYYDLTSVKLPYKTSVADDALNRTINSGPKNLLPYDAPTFSKNNITWTNNGDGTWTVSTSAASSQYYGYKIVGNPDTTASYADALPLPRGKYILTGLPLGASSTTYRYVLRIYTSSTSSSSTSLYEDYAFEVTNDVTRIDLSLYVATGVTIASPGVTYRPMLSLIEIFKMTPDFQPYRPSYQLLSDREKTDRERLIELLDNGPKNLVNYTRASYTHRNTTFTNNGDGTITVTTANGASQQYYGYRIVGDPDTTGWQYGVPIPKGKYILTGLPSGAASNTYRYILGIATSSTATRTSTSIYDTVYQFEVTNDTTRIDLSAYVATGVNLASPGVTYYPMICRLEDYELSPTYQPYRPSYQQLYDMVKALQNGS